MNVREYITNDFVALSPNDSSERAIELFQELGFDYLPIVDNEELVSCLSKDFSLIDKLEDKISSYVDISSIFCVNINSNLLDALKVLGDMDTNIIPVCGENHRYSGYLTQEDLMSYISNTPLVDEFGGVLLIKKGIKEFSISEISKIVESENAKVLGVFISEFLDDEAIITLKVNQLRLANIEAALKRFGYQVIESYHNNRDADNLEDRYKSLMKYLDI